MKPELVLMLDCDGVLADYVGASLDVILRRLGRHYLPEQVTAWDFSSLPGWHEISDQYWELARSIGFCSQIEPFPGAVEGVRRLREIAHVEFLTSPLHRSPTWTHERDAWLERHFGAHHHDILHVRKKYRVKADVLVDDNLDNVRGWTEHHPDGMGILWSRPYNQDRGEFACDVVESWDWLVSIVRQFAQQRARE
jgi:5'(3')-deoxyribonucleotidase